MQTNTLALFVPVAGRYGERFKALLKSQNSMLLREAVSVGKDILDFLKKDDEKANREYARYLLIEQEGTWGGLTNLPSKAHRPLIYGAHPAQSIAGWLQPLLVKAAGELYALELEMDRQVQDRLKELHSPKQLSAFEKLCRAAEIEEIEKYAAATAALKSAIKEAKSFGVEEAYLLARGADSIRNLGKKRRDYLALVRRLRGFALRLRQSTVIKAHESEVPSLLVIEFVADTLEACAPYERIVALRQCACCHRHAMEQSWKPGKDMGKKSRVPLCDIHRKQVEGRGKLRRVNHSQYVKALKLQKHLTKTLNEKAMELHQSLWRAASSNAALWPMIYEGTSWTAPGYMALDNPENIRLLAENLPLLPKVRKSLEAALRKNQPWIGWAHFLAQWYAEVDDRAAAEKLAAIAIMRENFAHGHNVLPAKNVDVVQAHLEQNEDSREPSWLSEFLPSSVSSEQLDAGFYPDRATRALYDEEEFIDDLVRYQVTLEVDALPPEELRPQSSTRPGRPEVSFDHMKALQLRKEGRSTREIAEALGVAAEKMRLYLKAADVAEEHGVARETVQAIQREILRAKRSNIFLFMPDYKKYNLSPKVARAVVKSL